MRRVDPKTIEPYRTLDGSLIRELVHPKRGSEVKNLSVALAEIEPGSRTEPHVHEFDEVYVVLEGRPTINVGDETHECSPGDVVEIPEGTLHNVENPGPTTAVILCVCSPPYTHRGTHLRR